MSSNSTVLREQMSALPPQLKVFESSLFHPFYSAAQTPTFAHELLGALKAMFDAYCVASVLHSADAKS